MIIDIKASFFIFTHPDVYLSIVQTAPTQQYVNLWEEYQIYPRNVTILPPICDNSTLKGLFFVNFMLPQDLKNYTKSVT